MTKPVTIQFRRDVTVDLNAYFDSFSKPLRVQIENELFKLLGGQPRGEGQKAKRTANGYIPINTIKALWIDPKASIARYAHSKTAKILAEVKRRYQSEKFTLEQFEELFSELKMEGKAKTWVANLIIANHLRGEQI